MILPKRFKLAAAASAKPIPDTGLQLDVIHVRQDSLLVSNGLSAAVVPLLSASGCYRCPSRSDWRWPWMRASAAT
jgi:hypothetical protein